MAARRRTRGWLRTAAVTAGVAAALAFPAAPAAADDDDGDDRSYPLTFSVDCVIRHDDRSWSAVLGYRNSSSSPVRLPSRVVEWIEPYAPGMPTSFAPGTHRGAFAVTVSRSGSGFVWPVGGQNLVIRVDSGPACPPATEMPADGNGSGAVFGFAVAGLAGAVVVTRARRRTGADRA